MKLRTPTRCQNGHFRWYYYRTYFGQFEARWGEREDGCLCPTHEIGEGFKAIGDDLLFTGINDKHGTPIYDKDIIRHFKYGGDHVVKWIPESTGFFVGEQAWPLSALCSPSIEVIGNIYEPPAKENIDA